MDLPHLHILLADDSPDDRSMATHELRQEFPKLKITPITDKRSLEKALTAANFDLVITDYRLGWTDGLKLFREVKTRNPNCPVIMFTSTGTQEVAVEAMKSGLDDYVIKTPAGFTRLPIAVRSALQRVAERERLKMANQALRRSEQRFRMLTEGALVGVYIIQEGIFRYVNPALSETFGYAPHELIDRLGPLDLTHPEDHSIVRENIAARERGEVESVRYTFRGKRKDGEVIHCEVLGRITEYQGKPAIMGTLVDYTPRLREEQKLLSLSQAASTVLLARTAEEVYSTIGKQIKKLGFQAVVLTLTPDGEHLRIFHLTFNSRLVKAVEKLAGTSVANLQFPITQVRQNALQKITSSYWESAAELLARGLPPNLEKLTPELARILGIEQAILAPLGVGETWYGLLMVAGKGLDESYVPAVATFANQAAIALENLRLIRTAQEQRQLAESLRDSTEILNSSLDFEQILDHMLDTVGQVVPYDTADIFLLDEEGMVTIARSKGYAKRGLEEWAKARRFQLSEFPNLLEILQRRQAFAIPDVAQYPGWVVIPETSWIRSNVCAPIITRVQLVGFISLNRKTPGTYSEEHANRLTAFANQAAVAMQNAWLFERVQASQDQLRALASYLQNAREAERMEIAREIHDEFAQLLTALKIDLTWMERHLDHPKEAIQEKLSKMIELVADSIEMVRRISRELRPGVLDDLGLIAAMEWQAEEFSSRSGVTCHLDLPEEEVPLQREVSTALFRIAQEALTNIARHAQANNAWVSFRVTEKEYLLSVEDDGIGITIDQLRDPKSLGLMGMQERARSFGGDVTFHHKRGKGTRVEVHIPRITTS